jgi:succinate dehydrogenase/fumarate reductase flavoprotein subunit
MAFVLAGSNIRRPMEIDEANSTQMAQHRTLDGAIKRDYFGDNKRVWRLSYQTTNVTDFNIIKTIYNTYLSTNSPQTWEITESNYTVAQTTVHVDLLERGFSVKGTDYLSNFELILTEE